MGSTTAGTSSQSCNDPGPSRRLHVTPANIVASPLVPFVEVEVENTSMLSPTMPSSQVQEIQPGPALSEQSTPRHSRPIRTRGSHRRRVRPHTQSRQHNSFSKPKNTGEILKVNNTKTLWT
ncbi:unnamed protein product [Parnassius apollo]|uniref:(apollo) hypothetical protein n=1 Tax=Parnassius apollo TaxID=110799 RepID=A0A8S3XDW5_PARAO|nr:unnamed protein product [Parnassius apollo]